jgi:putative membrane protein
MKRLYLSVFVITALCAIQACNNNAQSENITNPDSISSADSIKAVKDSSSFTDVPADKGDTRFLAGVAGACIIETELGKLALHNAENKRVKNFGAMMVKDHSKATNKLMLLAKSKHIVLPTTPNAAGQKNIDNLAKKSGKDFDKAYVSYIIADHKNYINEFENESVNASDPDIKSFASKTLRVLKNHMDAINTINGSMK